MDYDYLEWWAKLMCFVVAVVVIGFVIAAFLVGRATK